MKLPVGTWYVGTTTIQYRSGTGTALDHIHTTRTLIQKMQHILQRIPRVAQIRRIRPYSATAGASTATADETPTRDASFNSLQDEINDANKRYNNILKIHHTNNRDWGLSATRTFFKGQKVMSSKALGAMATRDSHSVQTGWNQHVLIDLPARFINHSCGANVGIRDNVNGAFDFFALKEIKTGNELLWDYEASEYEIRGFETCLCGSERCRGSLGGFKKHGDGIKLLYGDHYADYLKGI